MTDNRNREQQRSDYSFAKIRTFLQKTKNMKRVQVMDLFIDIVGTLMRGEGTDQFAVC